MLWNKNYGVGVPRKWHKIDLTPELTEYAFEPIIPHDATETGAIAFFLGVLLEKLIQNYKKTYVANHYN